ncbi:MAG: amidohydrolase [Roseburia sp.]|nr:amidohydrolase [Roseburia sp.]
MADKLLIKQANIHSAVEKEVYVADVLVADGKIVKIEEMINGGEINDAQVLDAYGYDLYPGFVDAHCHLGLDGHAVEYPGQDFNEMSDPVTPQLSAVDGINPQDETFCMAREGGVTCVATGPGSSNVFGGTFCVIKTYGYRIDDMLVKEKAAMKISFGENPKNCYREKGFSSRMSIAAKLREMLTKAKLYQKKLEAAGYSGRTDYSKLPAYDAKLESLLPVLKKEIPLKAHVHRADDIFTAIRIAKEFDVDLRIDHTTDGSLIAKDLAKEGYPVAVGPSFGHASKYELKNKGFHTVVDLVRAGCQVSIITDSPVTEERYLALCAGRAIYEGLDEFTALQTITINAAKHIGVEKRVGSIEVGKDADFVLVKGSPFEVNSRILYTIIEGKIVYKDTSEK